MAQQDINNLKNRATVIKSENQDGANTADRVGGLLYDIIDTFGGMIGSGISSGLNNPLAAINSANLGNPSGDKILAYQNSIWKYIAIPTGAGTVDWNNITNKPDLTGLSYLPDTTRYGSSLAINGNTITLKDASNAALSSINLGNSSLVYYGTDTLPDESTTQSSITAGDIRLSKGGGSSTECLWATGNGTLMFGNSPVSGIQWGENTVPDVSIQPKIIIKGDLYVEKEDGSNLGGKVQADNLALFTTQIDEDNNLSYVYRSICLTGGELSFDGFNLTVPDGEGGHKLNIDESILIPDDLHLNGNHLYLWNTVNETTIGSGVELPASGGGGGGSSVSWNDITGKPNVVTFDSHGNIEVEGNHLIRIEDVECGSVESNALIVRGYDSTADQTVTVGEIDGAYGSLDEPELMIQTFDNRCVEIVTPHLYLNGQELFAGGGGSTKLKVGSTTVSPDSNGIITIGYGGGTTVSTGTNSITISSTSGSGGVSKLKVGNTDVLPDSNGAITFAGSGVSASGSTITITGSGGGWTPPSGTSTTLETDDITDGAITKVKLAGAVKQEVCNDRDSMLSVMNTLLAGIDTVGTNFGPVTATWDSTISKYIFNLPKKIPTGTRLSDGYYYCKGIIVEDVSYSDIIFRLYTVSSTTTLYICIDSTTSRYYFTYNNNGIERVSYISGATAGDIASEIARALQDYSTSVTYDQTDPIQVLTDVPTIVGFVTY